MAKKFVSESRYKKTTRTKAKLEKKVKTKDKQKSHKIIIAAILVFVLIILSAVISVKIINKNKTKKTEVQNKQEFKSLNENEFKIGVNKLVTKQPLFSGNLYVNELNKYVYLNLLKIDTDYNIIYEVAKEVQKINNKEYVIVMNNEIMYGDRKITIYDLKNTIEQILKLEYKTTYFDNLKSIKEVSVLDNYKLKITLSKEDPYFVYKLQIPVLPISKYNDITKIENDLAPQNVGGTYSVMQTDEKIVYERNEKGQNTYPKKIELIKTNESEELIEKFKKDEIDMFFTTIKDLSKQLGKYEYNLKQFRSGENIFLFGNKNHKAYANKEVRLALSYVINRDEIIQEIYGGMGLRIDTPYIYSDTKLRHDTIAANNTLVNAGYEKKGGLYTKDNNPLIMKLLVGNDDSRLVDIAKNIKSSAEECGIRIDINEASSNEVKQRVNAGDYELVLAKVSMNEVPDLTFIEKHISINETVNKSINDIKKASIKDLPNEIRKNQNILNDEMPCIGIVSETIGLVSKKNIKGFENIGYLSIFRSLEMVRREK